MSYALKSGVTNASGQSKVEIAAPLASPSTPSTGFGTDGVRVIVGPTDPISNIPVFIPYDHHQIHEGEAWKYDDYTANLASGSSRDIVLTVPNIALAGALTSNVIACPHFRYSVSTNDLANIFLYEGPTVTAATGTAASWVNRERNGVYTAKTTILLAPTITGVGTLIDSEYLLAAATNQNSGGGNTQTVEEFVLKNNTKYLFRVTSGANGCDVHIEFEIYEDLGV